ETTAPTGMYFCKHDGIYLIPTVSYIHPDDTWSYHKLNLTFLKWTVGVVWQ
ncbi:hypothetical protein LCGC14_1819670, partial [marine sediment metagenome]